MKTVKRYRFEVLTWPCMCLAIVPAAARRDACHRWCSCLSERGMVPTRQEQFSGRVIGIVDCDTLIVLRDGKAVKVRLYGVDTPEKAEASGRRAH